MTFLLFMPASKKWLGWCKTQDPPWNRLGSLWLDLLYSHTSILFFVTCYQWWFWPHKNDLISIFFQRDHGQIAAESMSNGSLIKYAYDVTWLTHRSRVSFSSHKWLCIYKHLGSLPDKSLSFTNLWLKKICHTLFLSLWGNNAQSTNKQDEWING